MALESFDMQSAIDIAFVLLVAFTCGRSLLGSTVGAGGSPRARWKEELEALQVGLKELIGEAGAASSRLDRSLEKRRVELETLLNKLEAAELRLSTDDGMAAASTRQTKSSDEAFPNDTWCRGPEKESAGSAASYQAAGAASKPAPTASLNKEPGTGAGEGPSLQGYTRSKVPPSSALDRQFSGEEVNPVVEAVQKSMASAQSIASATPPRFASDSGLIISSEEEELDEDEILAQQTFEQTSIMDLVTYRIARRLLDSGKELHVVARKVDMPVSEIRLLDNLMRQEKKIKEERKNQEAELADTLISKTISAPQEKPKKKPQIIAAQPTAREFTPGRFGRVLHEERLEERRQEIELQQEIDEKQTSRNLDEDIERELALL